MKNKNPCATKQILYDTGSLTLAKKMGGIGISIGIDIGIDIGIVIGISIRIGIRIRI